MVGGRQPERSEPDLRSSLETGGIETWFRPLQQALGIEADRGFGNLQGRSARFSDFIVDCLRTPPIELAGGGRDRLADLADPFTTYEQQPLGRRRALVQQLRQRLHEVRLEQEPTRDPAPPRPLQLTETGPSDSAGTARHLPTTPLGDVAGVGPRTATRLASLGLLVARDLLHHFPRDYLDYAHLVRIAALEPGRTATVVASVRRSHAFSSTRNPNLSVLELQLQDVSGRLRVTRFFAGRRFTSPGWLKAQQRQFPPGATVAVSGLVREGPHGPSFSDPLLEVLEHPRAPVRSESIGRLVPVYALTEGLSAERVRRSVQAVLPSASRWPDPLPAHWRQELTLMERGQALRAVHTPDSRESLQAGRRRLVFDELLLLQLSLGQRRLRLRQAPAPALAVPIGGGGLVAAFQALLPFPFTGAQQRVLSEILHDVGQSRPMARLLQGDVGSGKTVVALAALMGAIDAGFQGALMAPTEVLAEQHLREISTWLPHLQVSFDLLTGSTPVRRRRSLLQDLANGQLQLLVGTHALIEDPVQFDRLGLVVVDEQHRFGVRQRNRLLSKGLQPHLLTMTATPIPRTLALSLHGDLDVSQIDELPPGRLPITTKLLRGSQRKAAYELIREEVGRGRRAYVVLPLVEDSETLDLRSAVEVHRQLQEEVFPELTVGLLHGRLASEGKQAAIRAFAEGACQLLVCTTVVEVGVNVPEASVMVIEHAERFGLAQLHQLRGRVGRGSAASFCLLIQDGDNATARQRLEVLVRSTDGFEIAEMDLRLRGPGQVLGTRQSGLPDLALASLADDGAVLEEARNVAQRVLATDPELEAHPGLREDLARQQQRLVDAAQLN